MFFYIKLLKFGGIKFKGKPRYIGYNVIFDDFNLIEFGDRVVISDDCHFLTHDYSITTVLIYKKYNVVNDLAINRGICVGNNVFIGKKSIIMPNSIIGNNIIIGAGSIVRGYLEDGFIYSGNPAIKVKSLDSQYEKWLPLLESDFIRIDK
ncbi:acyltransferase [Algoriphagus ornithinivorans]|nr:acyltransferase [Algoriphagus ornithinivorans]